MQTFKILGDFCSELASMFALSQVALWLAFKKTVCQNIGIIQQKYTFNISSQRGYLFKLETSTLICLVQGNLWSMNGSFVVTPCSLAVNKTGNTLGPVFYTRRNICRLFFKQFQFRSFKFFQGKIQKIFIILFVFTYLLD